MALGNKKKDKPITISKTEYGKTVLSYIVTRHGNNFDNLLKDIGKEKCSSDYLIYLQYMVYISEKILESKYSSADAYEIALASFDGIVEYFEVDDETRITMAKHLKDWYMSLKEFIKFGIYEEKELKSLVDAFLEDINVSNGFFAHMTVFVYFSSYIIYHSSSILNNEITVV